MIMKPYGLVLAGGGAKGAYQIGAWKAMREIGIKFEAVAGVSIGSINGALVASGDYNAAINLWNSVSVSESVRINEPLPDPDNLFGRKNWGVLFREVLKNGGFDASPVKDFLKEYIDEEKVRNSGVPLGIVTIQMTQGVLPLELFTEDIPDGQLIDYLLASSNIPLANNIGPEGERFLDGGAYDNTPVSLLRKNGYNRLIVVDISSIKGINHNLDIKNCEIVYIRPHNIDDLGASFDFDNEMNEKRSRLGYLDTMKAFSYLLGRIYYFEPQTFRNMLKKYGSKTVSQLEELAYKLKMPLCEVYSEERFISLLAELYEVEKQRKALEEAKAEMDKPEEQEENTDEHGHFYSSIKSFFARRKAEPDLDEATALLEKQLQVK